MIEPLPDLQPTVPCDSSMGPSGRLSTSGRLSGEYRGRLVV